MIVLVVAVVGYWVVQNATHDQPEVTPTAVAYRETVQAAQQGGYTIVYPAALPKDWIARDPIFTPGDRPVWQLPMLTDDGTFVGIHQADAPLSDLLDTDLPRGARQGDDVTLKSRLGGTTTWTSWSDGKRDHGFATEVGEDTLLVYGSAPVADLERLVEQLTTAPAA
jgi:hypothetical protein